MNNELSGNSSAGENNEIKKGEDKDVMIVCSKIKKLVGNNSQIKESEEENELILCSEINNDGCGIFLMGIIVRISMVLMMIEKYLQVKM